MAKVYYLTPSSFCFGVKRSVEELLKVIEKHPHDTIFCIHALVHNPKITQFFADRGVQFVESIEEVMDSDSVVVFSAHGITRSILETAQSRFKAVYNLECPFVSKVYNEANTYISQGITQFLYLGKANHQEARNVVDHIQSKGAQVQIGLSIEEIAHLSFDGPFAVLSQTTLNYAQVESLLEYIKSHFPTAILPKISDVCKATYERQGVIKQYLDKFTTLVVIGGKESSNTKELYTIGKNAGKTAFYAESLEELLENTLFLDQKSGDVAVTGGASTPVEDILEVIDWYEKKGYERECVQFV